MPLGRFHHLLGLLERDGHRLLDDHVLAIPSRQHRVLGMEAVGAGYPDGLDVRIAAQLLG